jgi:hypothetical protein
MELFRTIDWRLILKTSALWVALPWALIYLLLLLFAPPAGVPAAWYAYLGAVLVGGAYFATPAAAGYVAAKRAHAQPLIHAMLTVSLSLGPYLVLLEHSVVAIAVWPVMGFLGSLPSLYRPRAEA